MSVVSFRPCALTRQSLLITHHLDNWLGRKDSNLRMPDPKTGALPLGDAPTSRPREAPSNRAAGTHRAPIVAAPNRATWKDAPTRFKFNSLNGALLRILVVKNPEYCRTTARQQRCSRPRF